MSVDFGITINLGIGDILNYYSMLESAKYKYDNIYIRPLWKLIDKYRHGSKNFELFIRDLLRELFIDHKYKVVDSGNYPIITPNDLMVKYKLTPKLFKCKSLYRGGESSIDGQYIVITTKVRELPLSRFKEISGEFIKELNALSEKYKIVIIGESEVDNNIENKINGDESIYSAYKHLKEINNVIDLTVPVSKDIEFPFSIKMLKDDCALMNKAKCVITFGCGGNLALASVSANKLIGFKDDPYVNFDSMYEGNERVLVTKNSADFLNRIKDL